MSLGNSRVRSQRLQQKRIFHLNHSVQFSHSVVSNSLWRMDCGTPGLPVHHKLPEFTQSHVHWVSDAIQPAHPLSSHFPPALNFSQHQDFSSESVLRIRWPKHWSFSLSVSPSSEYSGLISFRMDWLDLLAGQETLKSLLQTTVGKPQLFSAQPSGLFRPLSDLTPLPCGSPRHLYLVL